MKKKAAILILSCVFVLAQSVLGLAAGSPSTSGGSGGGGGGGGYSGKVRPATNTTNLPKTPDTLPLTPAVAAPAVDAATVQAKTAALEGKQVVSAEAFNSYKNDIAEPLVFINKNPQEFKLLTFADETEKSENYSMLTTFREVYVNDGAGNAYAAKTGECIVIHVPALTREMKVFLVYVNPVTGKLVKVSAAGVNYDTQQVLVDVSIPGAFTIVYEK